METKAILRVDILDREVGDLYLPEDVWNKLVKALNGSNRLTVVLRKMDEYRGKLEL